MSKEELCRKFVVDPSDDIYELVETLVEIRDEECPCVYPGKNPCTRKITTPFGFCTAHLKTKKGIEVGTLWNDTLEELDIEESEEEEEEEEEEVVKEVTLKDVPKKETDDENDDKAVESAETSKEDRPTEDKNPSVKKDKPTEDKKPVVKKDKPTEDKKPVVKKDKSTEDKKPVVKKNHPKEEKKQVEDDDSPDDSGVAKYVPQKSEDAALTSETSEDAEEEEETEKIRFVRSKFNNFVNPETKIVVRSRDHVILGVENDEGGIGSLSEENIEWCKKRKFNYISQ